MAKKRKRPKLKDNLTGTMRRKPETPLYVPCPQCDGTGESVGGVCVCHRGYIETGFTQERYDRLVTRNDRLLISIDNVLTMLGLEILPPYGIAAAIAVLKSVAGTAEEVETARSHFRTDK